MSKDIRIKKGLDIKLVGEAQKVTENAIVSNFYSIRPEDFHSIISKTRCKRRYPRVKAGEPLFYNKDNEYEFRFASFGRGYRD
jgi:Na+-transporting NADH:ubiquinone oxidoreductase subunit A